MDITDKLVVSQKRIVPLSSLYIDSEWSRAVGKAVIPLGIDLGVKKNEDEEESNLYGSLDNNFNLIIGGAVNSGKKTFLHCAIVNLLNNTRIEDLKLILIDPLRVVFDCYNNLPNLIFPVAQQTSEARTAFEYCNEEINRRLKFFADSDSADLSTYNKKSNNKIPRIVVIVSEAADLFVTDHEFYKEAVQKICQKGCATGINIILCSQRIDPINIFTKDLLSDFVYRIAFRTASEDNSITILGESGAEKLRGEGDALLKIVDCIFSLSDDRKTAPYHKVEVRHIQGYYVGAEDIKEAVNNYLKK